MVSFDWSRVVLVAALLLYLYPFLLYPLLLKLLVEAAPLDESPPEGAWPSVALIICALNEQKMIGDKIENSLALDYPPGKLKVVVVSDGSTDRTVEIARSYVPSIELIEHETRRGKVANLNDVIPAREEEIIALSDANVLYDPAALRHLISRFRDARVGGVSGRVILVETTGPIQVGEENYYSLEWGLQIAESRIHSMVGVDGAMYALRRELFTPCPDDTIIEDFVIAMGVVRRGWRFVFEPRALAWESGVSSLREEFRRKVRIAAGSVQALVRGNGWPRSAPLGFWFLFLSHKLLRWFSPLVAAVVLCAAVMALPWWPARVVLAGAGALALAAAARWLLKVRFRLLDAAFYFLFGQLAMGWGLLKGFTGTQSVLWAKADR